MFAVQHRGSPVSRQFGAAGGGPQAGLRRDAGFTNKFGSVNVTA
jgi:hypothetical protein